MALYFLDTEFIEYPNTIELISIGIVSDDGREYYAVSSEYDYDHASMWVKNNVIKPMYKDIYQNVRSNKYKIEVFHKYEGKSIKTIASEILDFVGFPDYKQGKPEFWGYFSSYDYVVFCWIFGTMMNLPEGFPEYCNDLQQLLVHYKLAKLPDPVGEHNALIDAKWNKVLYEYIMEEIG